MSLEAIANTIADCDECGLCRRRELPVPGAGPVSADIVFIGGNPGNEEDLQGQPFLDPAGKLLTRLLSDAGIKRDQVFLTYVVKCRPSENPTPQEIGACREHLRNQLALIDPKVVVTLGRMAASACTGHYGPIQGLQEVPNLKTSLTEEPTPVVVAYHPSYLLRLLRGGAHDKVQAKRVYEDFKLRFLMAIAHSRGESIGQFFGEEEIDIGAVL
jgi:DNA polymerase